jgi:hypothetical protein
MGGKSEQTQTQSSTTNPWEPAQGALKGILGQLNSYVPQAGATGLQGNAIDQINANNARFSSYAPSITGITNELLAGGGAMNQAGAINQNYLDYQKATQPLASNTNYDPMQTPGIGDQLAALKDDISQSVNGQFAAAGRDFSGYNQKALGRGISAGLAPVLTSQYNQNVQNQQGAAGNLYNAGNTNAGLLSGLQQQSLANKGAGISSIGAGLDASNAAANSTLAAEAQRLGIPLQNLGLLAQIGVPIAGLGGTSSGTSTGTQKMSGVDQFYKIASGLGALMPKGPISFGGG